MFAIITIFLNNGQLLIKYCIKLKLECNKARFWPLILLRSIYATHPAKMDLDKMSGPKPGSVQTMLFDAQALRKTMN